MCMAKLKMKCPEVKWIYLIDRPLNGKLIKSKCKYKNHSLRKQDIKAKNCISNIRMTKLNCAHKLELLL